MEPRRLGPKVDGEECIVVAAALREEVAPLVARLESPSAGPEPVHSAVDAPIVTSGVLEGHRISVLVTGDGARRARRGTEWLLQRSSVQRLLVVGVAGGLTHDLESAELVVAQQVIGSDGRRFSRQREETEGTARRVGARIGTVVTSSGLALSAEEKRRVRETTVPDTEACVVDLETAAFVDVAERHGVPWEVIRAVSDVASEDLPDFLGSCAGPDGEIRRSFVVRHAASHPWEIPGLLRLRSRLARCAQSLAAAAVSWVGGVKLEALRVATG